MRVLAHVDLDAFYTQVEAKRDPSLRGTPLVVVQYNPYGDLRTLQPGDNRLFPESNGSIIAVSYEARKHGVKRNMMAQQAKKLCPQLNIVQVPVAHGKADLTIYREAGAAVISVLSSQAVCERASIDEAYLDVTAGAQQLLAAAQQQQQQQPQSGEQDAAAAAAAAAGAVAYLQPGSVDGWHVAGMAPGAAGVAEWWSRPPDSWSQDEQLLAAGAVLVAQLRAAVAAQLGFSCSAGVAHSKILAKLGSGLNKPAQQTLVPAAAVPGLLGPLPLPKLRQLGGKFGEEVMQGLGVATVGELAAVPLSRLEALVGEESAAWLQRLAQGKDDEEVKPRTLPKSISCGKTFRGASALTGLTAVHTWLKQLASELQERVEADRRDNQRLPSLLTVSIDTLPAGTTAAAAAGSGTSAAAAAAAGEVTPTAGSGGTSAAVAGAESAPAAAAAAAAAGVGGGAGRATAQTWRLGVVSVSRSTPLRRPLADVMAEDALKLVKKWARDRGQGWKIIGMFISATNFVAAPTGASTLERFISAAPRQQQQQQQPSSSAGGAAGAAAAGSLCSTGIASGDDEGDLPGRQQQQQQWQQPPPAAVSPSGAGTKINVGKKRPAAEALRGGSSSNSKSKAAKGSLDLRAFMVAPAAVSSGTPAAGSTSAAAAAGVTAAATADLPEQDVVIVEQQVATAEETAEAEAVASQTGTEATLTAGACTVQQAQQQPAQTSHLPAEPVLAGRSQWTAAVIAATAAEACWSTAADCEEHAGPHHAAVAGASNAVLPAFNSSPPAVLLSSTGKVPAASPVHRPVSALSVLGINRTRAATAAGAAESPVPSIQGEQLHAEQPKQQQQQQQQDSQQHQDNLQRACLPEQKPSGNAAAAAAAAAGGGDGGGAAAAGPTGLRQPDAVSVPSQPGSALSQPSQSVVQSLRGWLDPTSQELQQAAAGQQQSQGWHHQQQQQPQQQHCDVVLVPPVQQVSQERQQLPEAEADTACGHTAGALQYQESEAATGKVGPGAAVAPAAAAQPESRPVAQGPGGSSTSSWQQPQLRLSDIDPEVLSELPLEIQLEVRRAAGATAGPAGGRGSSSSSKQSSRPGKQGRAGGKQLGLQQGAICKYFSKSS